MSAIGGGPAAGPIGRVQELPEAPGLELRVGERDRGRECRLEDGGRDHLPAVELPVLHQGRQPPRDVVDRRDDRSGRAHARLLAILRSLVKLEGVPAFRERDAVIRLFHHLVDRVDGARDAERSEDPLAHEVLPGLPGDELDRVAGARVHQVVVEEGAAQRLRWLEQPKPLEELLAREVRLVPDGVVAGDSGPVGEHVPDRHRGVELVVVEANARDVLPHRLVPVELALLDEQAGRHRGEELGVGGDGYEGLRRERELLAVVTKAIPLREDELALDHDADTHPGDVPILDDLPHGRVEGRKLLRERRILHSRSHGGESQQHAAGDGRNPASQHVDLRWARILLQGSRAAAHDDARGGCHLGLATG